MSKLSLRHARIEPMSSQDQLPRAFAQLTDADILAMVDGDVAAVARGASCYRSGRVHDVAWDGNRLQLWALVTGSQPTPYTAIVFFGGGDATLVVRSTVCTCPSTTGCKHIVALLMAARDQAVHSPIIAGTPQLISSGTGPLFGAPQFFHAGFRDAPAPLTPEWQRQLTRLMPAQTAVDHRPPPGGFTPLGLQFRVDGITRALSPSTPFTLATDLSLSIRPVYQDIKGKWKPDYGLTWHGSSNYSTFSFDPQKTQWLSDLAGLNAEIGRAYYWAGEARWQLLNNFADAGLWILMREGQRLGIPFVGNAVKDTVRLADAASLQINLTRGPSGDISCTRLITFDGRPARPTLMGAIGSSGLFAVEVGPAERRVTFAQAQPRLTEDDTRLLDLGAVNVPADDVDNFMSEFYPTLRRRLSVISLDASVDLPTPARPVLVGHITTSTVRCITVDWSWRYGTISYPFVNEKDAVSVRDEPSERAIINSVEHVARTKGGFESFRLLARQTFDAGLGLEARTFVGVLLPLLIAMSGVEMTMDGDLPQYRDIVEAALITVSANDSGDNDWFDLGIEITAGGVPIPFQEIFVALATGHTKLVLTSGEVVNIDAPEFARLKELIDEARALNDHPSKGLQISRFQPGLWSDLTELATDVVQADGWKRSVTDLIDLVNRGEGVATVDLPAGLTAHLRPYQRHAYEWLTFMAAHGLGGILADDMGLGKTVEVLAWIAGLIENRQEDDAKTPFMVIAPASVVGNWLAEAQRFTPNLRVKTLTETLKKAGTSIDQVIVDTDIIVTSYAIFRLDYESWSQITWAGLVLDEAQFVKNSRSAGNELARTLPARIKIAVTGTPMENDVMELWALLSIVAPGFSGIARHFREMYGAPISKAATVRQRRRLAAQNPRHRPAAEDPIGDDEIIKLGDQRLAQLRRRLRPLLLRRTKELVAPELPSRTEQTIQVDLAGRHRTIYDTYLQRERQRVLGLLGDLDKNRFAIFRSLTILRRLALDASLIEPEKYANVPSAKLDVLMEQVQEVVASGHRALIFSQFTTFLAKAVERLNHAKIDFAYLDGHTRYRDRVIQRFRDQDVPVFCLSLKAGGFGLTLTEADYVFLLDPWWNPATEQQAIDRTHRIGQTRNVMVVRLVSQGTIEDKVMALQARKREVFNAVLGDDEGEASFASALTADDIRSLLLD